MAYIANNPQVFNAAFAGALAAIGSSGKAVTDPASASYANNATVAAAFAQQFDTSWGSGNATDFELDLITALCEAYFQERNPLNVSPTNTAGNYSVPVLAIIAEITAGSAKLAAEPIPNPSSMGQLFAYGICFSDVPDLNAFVVADVAGNHDGITFIATQNVLLVGQAVASQNGLYTVGTVAAGVAPLKRAIGAEAGKVAKPGLAVSVSSPGGVFQSTEWFAEISPINLTNLVIGGTATEWYPRQVTLAVSLGGGAPTGTFTTGIVPIRDAATTQVSPVRREAITSLLTVGGYHPTTIAGADSLTAGRSSLGGGAASLTVCACLADGTVNAADGSDLRVTIEN
jgi:hypothetical protein